jgi:hypothetical protein
MAKLIRTTLAASVLAVGSLAVGCIGVSQSQQQCPTDEGGATAATGANIKSCPGDTKIAGDGDLDDFEDQNSQIIDLGGRNGYWWSSHDDKGSTIEPEKFTTVEGGVNGSKALRWHGRTSSADGAYGSVFGFTFNNEGTYDAAHYVGVRFMAKVGADTHTKVRFHVGDINTHKDAGVCKDCWNHFGKNMEFTTEWQEYKVLFSELKQRAGWGDPRPPSVTPDKLWNLDWSIIDKGVSFDIYLDDIAFLDCA